MGRATIVMDGKKRYAACIGGIISVLNGEVRLVPTTFEWAEEIDAARAERSAENARRILADKSIDAQQRSSAEAHLKRALVRISVAQQGNH
jgi:F-type H+-transporting ATPase subunit epsilon